MAHHFRQVTTNAGPYVLADKLGSGASGDVHIGIHYIKREKVAVKVLFKKYMDLIRMRCAKKELVIMKLIDHPHVISLKNVFETDDFIYIIMELAVGGTLFTRLKEMKTLSLVQAQKYTKQLISAIEFCHVHHICHRDIKAENILLDENYNIKVGDFGFAEFQRKEKLDEINRGSLLYSSPEVVRACNFSNSNPYNQFQIYDGFKADIWSFGVLVYIMITSQYPFYGSKRHEIVDKILKCKYPRNVLIPEELYEMFDGIFNPNPIQRWDIKRISHHPWLDGCCKEHNEENYTVAQPVVLNSESDIDQDILKDLHRLNYFSSKSKFITRLLSKEPNIERSLYTLLKKFRNSHTEFKNIKGIELHKLDDHNGQDFSLNPEVKSSYKKQDNCYLFEPSSTFGMTKPRHTISYWFRSLLGLPQKIDTHIISTYGKSMELVKTLVLDCLQMRNFQVDEIFNNKYRVGFFHKHASYRNKSILLELHFVDMDDEVESFDDKKESNNLNSTILSTEKIIVLALKHLSGSRCQYNKLKRFIETYVVDPSTLEDTGKHTITSQPTFAKLSINKERQKPKKKVNPHMIAQILM